MILHQDGESRTYPVAHRTTSSRSIGGAWPCSRTACLEAPLQPPTHAPPFLSSLSLYRRLELYLNARVGRHSCGKAYFVSTFSSLLPLSRLFLAQNQCLHPSLPFSSRVDRVRSLSIYMSLPISLFTPLAKFEYESHLSHTHSCAHSLTHLHTHTHRENLSSTCKFHDEDFWSPSGVHVRCVAVALVLALFDSLSIAPPPSPLSPSTLG